MGCPDWPTCFGRLVPPTSVNQLPADYKQKYAEYRDKKNQKFARYLKLLGFSETAEKIVNDDSILVEADFNPTRTWVEYVNRIVGMVIGFMIILLFLASWQIRKEAPLLYRWSLISLILVIFQGWFGSIVVSTNLTQWTITVHMFLALLMVAILVWLMVRSGLEGGNYPGIRSLLLAGMMALLIQIFLGTEVRESLDRLSSGLPRNEWISQSGMSFIVHRTFSWVVLAIQVILWLKLRKTSFKKSLSLVSFVLILASVLTGTAMAYLAVPPALQPVHLLLAVVTFGWFYQAYLQTSKSTAVSTR